MPITWITSLLGSLALIGTPLFSGFYSKDSIIEAVHFSNLPGAGFRLLRGARRRVRHGLLFVPHVLPGLPRQGALRPEPRPRITRPSSRRPPWPWRQAARIALGGHGAAGAAGHPVGVIGYLTIEPMLFGDFFKDAITINAAAHPAMARCAEHFHGPLAMALHAFRRCRSGWRCRRHRRVVHLSETRPDMPAAIGQDAQAAGHRAGEQVLPRLVQRNVLARGARLWAWACGRAATRRVIDGAVVNGSAAKMIGWWRHRALVQTGYLYHYALVMILGVFAAHDLLSSGWPGKR
jgi:NADH-quinone oxidoreductase subunit L